MRFIAWCLALYAVTFGAGRVIEMLLAAIFLMLASQRTEVVR